MVLDARLWVDDPSDAGSPSINSGEASRSVSSSTIDVKTVPPCCPTRISRRSAQPEGGSCSAATATAINTASSPGGWTAVQRGVLAPQRSDSPGSQGSGGRYGRYCSRGGGGPPSEQFGSGGGAGGSLAEHGGGGGHSCGSDHSRLSGSLVDIGELIRALHLPTSEEALESEGCFYDLSPRRAELPHSGPPPTTAAIQVAAATPAAPPAVTIHAAGAGAMARGTAEPGGGWITGDSSPWVPAATSGFQLQQLQTAAMQHAAASASSGTGPWMSQAAWVPAPGAIAILDVKPRVLATPGALAGSPSQRSSPLRNGSLYGRSHNPLYRPHTGERHPQAAATACTTEVVAAPATAAAAGTTGGSRRLPPAQQLTVCLIAAAARLPATAAEGGCASLDTTLEVVVRSQGSFLPASTSFAPAALRTPGWVRHRGAVPASEVLSGVEDPVCLPLGIFPAFLSAPLAEAAGGGLSATTGPWPTSSLPAEVEGCTCSITLHGLPSQPGLLLVEARRVGQIRGMAAVPVLLVDDPRVAEEVQTAVDGWRGDTRPLEDVLMDLGCFLRHAPAAAVNAIHPAFVDGGQATAAAVVAEPAVTAPASASYEGQDPVAVPISELMRTRLVVMGLHLMSWLATAPAAWPATLARLQSDMLRMGVSREAMGLSVARRPSSTAISSEVEMEMEMEGMVETDVAAVGNTGVWLGWQPQLNPADLDDVQPYDRNVHVQQHGAPASRSAAMQPPMRLQPPSTIFPSATWHTYAPVDMPTREAVPGDSRALRLPGTVARPATWSPAALTAPLPPPRAQVPATATAGAGSRAAAAMAGLAGMEAMALMGAASVAAAGGDGAPIDPAAPWPPPGPGSEVNSPGLHSTDSADSAAVRADRELPQRIATDTAEIVPLGPLAASTGSSVNMTAAPKDADARTDVAGWPGQGNGGQAFDEALCTRAPADGSTAAGLISRRDRHCRLSEAADDAAHGVAMGAAQEVRRASALCVELRPCAHRDAAAAPALRQVLWALLHYPYDRGYGAYVEECSAQQAHLLHALMSTSILLILIRSWISTYSCRNNMPCAGLGDGNAVLHTSSVAPILVACLPYICTGLGWLMFQENMRVWLRVVALCMPLRYLCHTLSCAMIAFFGFSAWPSVRTYQLSGAVFLGDGVLCMGSSLVHPAMAALHALLEVPVLAHMWMVIGSPYSRAANFLRAATYSLTVLATNFLLHVILRLVYERRVQRHRKNK